VVRQSIGLFGVRSSLRELDARVLLRKEVVPDDATDLNKITNEDEKKKKEDLRELNEDAYEDLILSINGETEVGRVVLQLVRGPKTKALADGEANEVWNRLTGNFKAFLRAFQTKRKVQFAFHFRY